MTDILNFFNDLQARLASAANETEVRGAFNDELRAHFNITFRLERGRSDARLNHVILEFKDKGFFNGNAGSAKFQEAYGQLTKKYIKQQAKAEDRPLHSYIGVAIDGVHYAFVFFEENGTQRHTALLPISPESLYPLIDALQKDVRRAFTSENLLEDFGSGSKTARGILPEFSKHLDSSLDAANGSQKVRMLFAEWKKLFAQATSLGRIGRAKIDEYLLSVGLTKPLDHTKALFVLHTYNALLFKLIAGELVTTIRYNEYSGFASEASGHSAQDLKDLLNTRIEHAEVFVANDIENFIEGTFFSWYLENAPDSLIGSVREMLARLGLYIFPTAGTPKIRDVVKTFYQGIVPDALRKNIGEFYTPEWLVDFVIDRAGYTSASALTKRFLDPCCGSGNFLIHAIARCKAASKLAGESGGDTAKRVLQNIVGFDLNPLAVISARLNYLLAIADVLPPTGRIEIPVYMADAVYAPVRGLSDGTTTRSYKIGTMLDEMELTLPEALVLQRDEFGVILSIMERDIETHENTADFVAHLNQSENVSGLLLNNPTWVTFLSDMFVKVTKMEEQNWNRIWCRIVRNYFASVAVGQVDVIAGNPPWVRWSELPEDYRERIKPTCSQYAIFSQTPFFGGNELDISGMIAYTVTDKWLAPGGMLGFVITQIHFQAPSSQGFRSFALPDETKLGVPEVHDFAKVKPFPRLGNKPAVFTWKRNSETIYPVPYKIWEKKSGTGIPEDTILSDVMKLITPTDFVAVPLPPDQRWAILPPGQDGLVSKLKGGSTAWQGRKGITADLNGVYFVELLGPGASKGLVKIRTRPDSGRKAVPKMDRDVDAALVYPLLKSASQIRPFSIKAGNLVAIVPNKTITSIEPESSFRVEYSATHKYFKRINSAKDEENRPLLEGRSTWKSRMKPTDAPFYAVYNVGAYTFSKFKVVWAEMSSGLSAAVVSTQKVPHDVGVKPVVPDHKVYFVATKNAEQAHFLCAMLNSKPVQLFVNSFTLKIQVGTIFRHLKLPAYDPNNKTHKSLAELSKKAHSGGLTEDLKKQIDEEACKVVKAMAVPTIASIDVSSNPKSGQ